HSSPTSAYLGSGRSQPPTSRPAASAAPSPDFSPGWAPQLARPNPAEKRRVAVRVTLQVPVLAIPSPADDQNARPNEEFSLEIVQTTVMTKLTAVRSGARRAWSGPSRW